jgi:hypothetical protein
MNILKKFENECRIIKEKYSGKNYRLTGLPRDKRLILMPVYSRIAKNYLFTVSWSGRKLYPAEQIEEICKQLDIPVEQVISRDDSEIDNEVALLLKNQQKIKKIIENLKKYLPKIEQLEEAKRLKNKSKNQSPPKRNGNDGNIDGVP